MSRPQPKGYTRLQIILHWLIFVLIVLQFVLHEPMSDAWRALRRGTEIPFNPLVAQHVFTGLLVLVLAVLRLGVKARRGAPPLPADEPKALKIAAHVTHLSLYALMILVPLSGAVAWFGDVRAAGQGHEVLKTLLLLAVVLHIAGALYQRFVLKSDIMTRMVKPEQ